MTDANDPAFGALRALAADHSDDLDEVAESLLSQLSLDDRMRMMSGDLDFWPGLLEMVQGGYNLKPYVGGAITDLGLPGIRFSDGPRGVAVGRSTCFPVSMARGATWDPDLEQRVGQAIGAEARAQSANVVGSVCINLLHHPAGGRAQETYGEDPVHVGEMGAAAVRGLQRHVMANVKHFALNNMENARFQVDVKASPRVLHEVYLPHFRRCIDEGAATVMTAYNSVNGDWCGHNRVLLTEILRQRWGFEGFVITDWIYGIRDAEKAANAGVDIEMPFLMHYAENLPRLVKEGKVPRQQIDDAARRIIRTMLTFAGSTEPAPDDADLVAGPKHRALAREVAQRSMVLLRNERVDGAPVLPLDAASLQRVAVIGPLADLVNTGDVMSSNVRPPDVVTPLAGLSAALEGLVVHDDGSDLDRAAAVATAADVAIVVVGYTAADEGEYIDMARSRELTALFPPAEPDDPSVLQLAKMAGSGESRPLGGDRTQLTLHDADEELLLAVAGAQPRTVAVIVCGSAVVTERWRDAVPAIVVSWYCGMEGGNALADVLLGHVAPSGRLPCAFPVDEADLPPFDRDAREVEYGLYHGQQHHDHAGTAPAFPLGFGLSYTSFEYGPAASTVVDGHVDVELELANTGHHPGTEIVQCYAEAPESTIERPRRWLVGFTPATLDAGARTRVHLRLPLERLAYFDEGQDDFVIEPTRYDLVVAPDAGADGVRTSIEIRTPSIA
jgi:beta-glucosidase